LKLGESSFETSSAINLNINVKTQKHSNTANPQSNVAATYNCRRCVSAHTFSVVWAAKYFMRPMRHP